MPIPAPLVAWLLEDADPSVRWRMYRDLLGRPEDDPDLAEARAAIGSTGWAERILAGQLAEGQWDAPGTTPRELYLPKYTATNWRLLVLSDLGVDRTHPGVARAVDLVLRRQGGDDGGLGGSDSEVCYTGNAVRMFTRFGYGDDPRVRRAVDWLVATQKADGGWHCFDGASEGTLDGWEALAGFSAIPAAQRSPAVERSIERGAEFYLTRGLLHEGERPYGPWRRLHYPWHYYYDYLVGLHVLTELGYGRDARLGEALDLLESQRRPDGRWLLDAVHPDLDLALADYAVRTPVYPFALELPGEPSRWITLLALRVLALAGRSP